MFLSNFFTLNAQKNSFIPRDTILKIFKNNSVYDALYKISINANQEIDYKSLYYDKELKEYLLKILNRNDFCKRELDKEIKKYSKLLEDKDFLKNRIKGYLFERKRGKQIDSILKSDKLIKKLKDSVLLNRILFEGKSINCKKAIPNLNLLTKIKYKEVYDSIKKWSKEIPEKDFMTELLSFNDPNSQKQFKTKIENYIKNNGKNESFRIYQDIIRECNTSYVYSLVSNLLTVNEAEAIIYENIMNKKGISIGTKAINSSVNFEFSRNIFYLIDLFKMPYESLSNEFNIVSDSGNEIEQDKFIKKNKKQLLKILSEGCNLMKKEEEYWMKNKPFYKKK